MLEFCEIQHKMKNLLWTSTRTVRVSCTILVTGLSVTGTKTQTLLTYSAVMLSTVSCLPPGDKFVVFEFSLVFIRSRSYVHKTNQASPHSVKTVYEKAAVSGGFLSLHRDSFIQQ